MYMLTLTCNGYVLCWANGKGISLLSYFTYLHAMYVDIFTTSIYSPKPCNKVMVNIPAHQEFLNFYCDCDQMKRKEKHEYGMQPQLSLF